MYSLSGFPRNGSHPPAVPLSPRLAAALDSLRVHHEAEVVVPENRLPWKFRKVGGRKKNSSAAGFVELATVKFPRQFESI